MIATVLFDLGGVVCRFVPERRLAALAAISPLPAATIQARLWDSGFDADCDRGRYPADEIVARVSAALGVPLTEARLQAVWALAFEPDAAVLAVAEALAPRVRTALLTNNGPLLYDSLPSLFPTIWQRFEPWLFSCNLGVVKPEPAIFAAVEARLGEPPERLLLLDDSRSAVEAARAAGWRAIHFTSPDGLYEALLQALA